MSDTRVSIAFCLPEKDPAWTPARFSPGKLAWLEQACYWVIRKLGGKFECYETHVTYQSIADHTGEIEKIILDSQESISEIWRLDLKHVLVGYQEMQEIRSWTSDAVLHLGYSYDSRGRRRLSLNGLNLTLVPWMKGIVVLPDIPVGELA